MRRPNILYLTPAWPLGPTYGGQLRALHTARALEHVGDVTVLVVGSEAGDADAATRTATEFRVAPPAPAIAQPNHTLAQRFRRAFDLRYLNVHGSVVPAPARERVLSYLPEYDLIWVLNARTPNLLQVWRWPNGHLDLDDIPSSYLQCLTRTERTVWGRWKARAESRLLYRREQQLGRRFATLSVCSTADQAYLQRPHVHLIPNGFTRPDAEPPRFPVTNPPRIGFIGLYGYRPNLEGIRWFLREAWPCLRREVPGVRFRIVGRDSDGPERPQAPDVDCLGWVDDPAEEIATWSVMVVPIRLGGGTRIKLADAFSRQCPVVATHFGAHGYEVQSGKHLLLADDPAAFAQACVHVIRHPAFARQMAMTAWHEFLARWTWDAITPRIRAAAEDCLQRTASAGFSARAMCAEAVPAR